MMLPQPVANKTKRHVGTPTTRVHTQVIGKKGLIARKTTREHKNTYNTRDSLVVTDPTTSLALTDLSMGERTGSRAFQWVWSYVIVLFKAGTYEYPFFGFQIRRGT